MRNKDIDSLFSFIDSSPTPYHVVNNMVQTLQGQDGIELKESEDWECKANNLYYVIRNDASIIAFRTPKAIDFSKVAFNMVAAHTDSPCLKLKPVKKDVTGNYMQWGVSIYGGPLLNSWLDRDLNISGRINYIQEGKLQQKLISIRDLFFRVPQLALHLDRDVNAGLKLNSETHMVPVLGLNDNDENLFEDLLLERLDEKGVEAKDISAMDLFFHESQPCSYGGMKQEFIFGPRIDNLAMTHASYEAFLAGSPNTKVSLIASFDHEEIGSSSPHGARSNFLNSVLERITIALGGSRQEFMKALTRSYLVSADMAHALHPNYEDRHDGVHRPLINEGPVIKMNAGMRFATDSQTTSRFVLLCRQADVPYQTFTGRNDIPSGSTVGPLIATKLGVSTIDVGNAQLGMHSAREMAGSLDHGMMIKVFTELFGE
jgi:aspartyl aminopeptidase